MFSAWNNRMFRVTDEFSAPQVDRFDRVNNGLRRRLDQTVIDTFTAMSTRLGDAIEAHPLWPNHPPDVVIEDGSIYLVFGEDAAELEYGTPDDPPTGLIRSTLEAQSNKTDDWFSADLRRAVGF